MASIASTSSNTHMYTTTSNSRHHHPNHRSCPSPRDPTIRHAGRAHIRGKIRRVWRPRYLELCDTGLVRYYELPPTADVTLPEDSDWDHVNMIPKDTLILHNARIIDVTTLRDLHVGLPRGSYGFLFKGQRQTQHYCNSTHHQYPENLVLGERTKDEAAHPPPREYFCAVSTLEEAQTWVIALQWAASVCEKNNYYQRSRPVIPDCVHVPTPISVEEEEEEDAFENDPRRHRSTSADTTTSRPAPAPRSGRIVVTKVHGYRIVRVATSSTMPRWDVAYEIALLILQPNLTQVEERKILRTVSQFERLFSELSQQVGDSKISRVVLDEWQPQLATLPTCGSSPVVTHERMQQSVSLVDGLLRALAMEAAIVNAIATKQWFVLDNTSMSGSAVSISPSSLWWKIPPTYGLLSSRRTIITGEMDDYVKKWLAKGGKSATKNMVTREPDWKIYLLQRPQLLVAGLVAGMALALPLLGIYHRHMISIRLRLDVLVLSWCVMAYVGKEFGDGKVASSSSLDHERTPRTSSKKIHAKPAKEPSKAAPLLRSESAPIAPTTRIDDAVIEETNSDESAADGLEMDYLEDQDEVDDSARNTLSSPLPQHPGNNGESSWSIPPDNKIFRVRGNTYLEDRVKIPSGPSPFTCRGVDVWLTDNPPRHIARHPHVLGGRLAEEDTFLVNFLLPFGNFVSYFSIPPLSEFPDTLANVWSKFLKGDQQYRDARLKLLPVVMDGPWIVKAAVGNGTAPALLGKVIPLQYFKKEAQQTSVSTNSTKDGRMYFEVDVIITASSIAKGILSVVKGHTKSLTIAFAFIIEAAEQSELPETVLCAFQVHQLHLEDCPHLPECDLDE